MDDERICRALERIADALVYQGLSEVTPLQHHDRSVRLRSGSVMPIPSSQADLEDMLAALGDRLLASMLVPLPPKPDEKPPVPVVETLAAQIAKIPQRVETTMAHAVVSTEHTSTLPVLTAAHRRVLITGADAATRMAFAEALGDVYGPASHESLPHDAPGFDAPSAMQITWLASLVQRAGSQIRLLVGRDQGHVRTNWAYACGFHAEVCLSPPGAYDGIYWNIFGKGIDSSRSEAKGVWRP